MGKVDVKFKSYFRFNNDTRIALQQSIFKLFCVKTIEINSKVLHVGLNIPGSQRSKLEVMGHNYMHSWSSQVIQTGCSNTWKSGIKLLLLSAYIINTIWLTAIINMLLFKSFILAPCVFVGRCRRFGETCFLHLQWLKWKCRENPRLKQTKKRVYNIYAIFYVPMFRLGIQWIMYLTIMWECVRLFCWASYTVLSVGFLNPVSFVFSDRL
jgi:hypothetical protein